MRATIVALSAIILSIAFGPGLASADRPVEGSGGINLGPSLVPGTGGPNNEPGRLVYLTDTLNGISGLNFEPGTCVPAAGLPDDLAFLNGKCFRFTNTTPVQPGQFLRARPGQTAVTYCNPCTIGGKTGSFELKISYPNPNNLTFTKFTIQNAAGALKGLQGQGTLDFTNSTYTINYHFQ
jgi:hypothetical protein